MRDWRAQVLKKSEFKVLVAEDDDIVRDVIVKFLGEQGYSVVVANDGLEAVKMLRLEDIKLVLSDLRMPGTDGMEVLRASLRINPRIAVVIITAYGTLDTALEAMNEGAYDYIVKPFVMQQLLLVVRNAYRMAMLIDENEKLASQLREIHIKLEACKNGNAAIEDLPGIEDKMHEPFDGDSESIRKYNSLVNDLKTK
jgi:DNA-binding NtrC family response regulator